MPDIVPRPEVMAFAIAMERQLRANDHKGGWQDMTPRQCLERGSDEQHEVWLELNKGFNTDGDRLRHEFVDWANFAMFGWHNARKHYNCRVGA